MCGKRKGGDYIVTPKTNDARKDQLKLASLSSGVEVAFLVSASINWGKRCPHFLANVVWVFSQAGDGIVERV